VKPSPLISIVMHDLEGWSMMQIDQRSTL